MLTRPPSRPRMAILKPSPSAPIRLRDRHAAVVEAHHRGGLRAPAHLLLGLAERQAGRALLDQERADPARPVAAGPAHDQVEVAGAGAGDERLAAVEHVGAVAFALARWCAGTRRPSPSRLGQAVAGQQPHGAQVGQPAAALRLVAEPVDHPRDHVVDREIGRGRGAARRSSSNRIAASSRVRPEPPDVLAHIDGSRSRAPRRCASVSTGKKPSSSHAAACGASSRASELPRHLLHRLLVGGQLEFQRRGSRQGHDPVSRPLHGRVNQWSTAGPVEVVELQRRSAGTRSGVDCSTSRYSEGQP